MEIDGLTNEQTDKVLQFQDLTGIEDMNVCRDVLIRHQWDLEVAFQEQLNIREGIPTMYAASRDVRAPPVIDDRFLQQVFTASMPGGRTARSSSSLAAVVATGAPMPRGFTGIIGYIINIVFQYCYSTFSGIISALLNIGRNDERITDQENGNPHTKPKSKESNISVSGTAGIELDSEMSDLTSSSDSAMPDINVSGDSGISVSGEVSQQSEYILSELNDNKIDVSESGSGDSSELSNNMLVDVNLNESVNSQITTGSGGVVSQSSSDSEPSNNDMAIVSASIVIFSSENTLTESSNSMGFVRSDDNATVSGLNNGINDTEPILNDSNVQQEYELSDSEADSDADSDEHDISASSTNSDINNPQEPNLNVVTDPLGDVMSFIRNYNEKNTLHPVFYQGTYAQALNDAKQELRFLLVYLHKDPTKNADVDSFCSQTLTNQSVINYINQNMLFWGCDVSSPEGYRVAHSLNARTYPLMVLIGLRSNKMVVVGRFEGDCLPEELVRRLQTVKSANEVWLSQTRADRLERNLTQTLRRQQDEAYHLSLRADEEKERVRQLELDAERQEQEALERERQEAERKKDEIAKLKIDLADRVPSEPPADEPDAISVVFKLPNGARIERRFHKTDSISDLSNYLFCHPSSPDEFEITTNFPKRVLYAKMHVDNGPSSSCNSSINSSSYDSAAAADCKTLAEVGLKNREVLFVNDLQA